MTFIYYSQKYNCNFSKIRIKVNSCEYIYIYIASFLKNIQGTGVRTKEVREEFGYRDTPVYENDDLKNFEKKIKIKMVIANQYNTKKNSFMKKS